MRGLGIEPEIELVARVCRLGIVSLRIQAAAHDHNSFRERGELGIDRDGQRDVGQRPCGVDGHLVRMRSHLANEKVRSVFVERLYGRHALGHRWNLVRPMRHRTRRTGRRYRDPSPCAEPRHLAIERFLKPRLLLIADQRKHRAANHGNIGVAGQLKHAQRVQSFLVAPRVAGHHGDSQHLHCRRLKQRQHRHLV